MLVRASFLVVACSSAFGPALGPVAAFLFLSACGTSEEVSWSGTAVLFDQPPSERQRGQAPVVELGATVAGEVLFPGANVRSAAPGIVAVSSDELDSSFPTSRFTLNGVAEGETSLLVELRTGERVSLPVLVSESATLTLKDHVTGETLETLVVTGDFTFLEADVRDAQSVRLTSPVAWFLDPGDVVAFGDPTAGGSYVGPVSSLFALSEGSSVLAISTGSGLEHTVAVRGEP